MMTTTKPEPSPGNGETLSPSDWPVVPLGEVAHIVSGLTLGRPVREKVTRKVPYLRVANVKDGRLDLTDVYEIDATEDEIEKCGLRHGDLLLTEGGDADKLGRGTFWQEQIPECLHQNHIFRVRLPADRFCHEFVSLQFGSPYGKAYFFAHAKQTTGIATINRGVLNRFPLLSPPLTQQKEIARRLREQLTAVAQARADVQAQLDAAQALPAAHLCAVFKSRVAERWPRRYIGDICGLLPSKSIALSGDTEVRTVTSACLTETGFNPEGVKAARMWAADARESVLRRGEILVSRSNTPDLVGRVSIYGGEPKGVVASDLTIRLWPRGQSAGDFLANYLSFLFVSGYWKDRAGGASGTMKKITRTQIKSQEVPAPSFAEQELVTDQLKAQLLQAFLLTTTLQDRLAAVDRLPGALLREVFKGNA